MTVLGFTNRKFGELQELLEAHRASTCVSIASKTFSKLHDQGSKETYKLFQLALETSTNVALKFCLSWISLSLLNLLRF